MCWTAYRGAYPKLSIATVYDVVLEYARRYDDTSGDQREEPEPYGYCPERSRESCRWVSVREMGTCVNRLVGVLSRAPFI